jgi:hypothetical protein
MIVWFIQYCSSLHYYKVYFEIFHSSVDFSSLAKQRLKNFTLIYHLTFPKGRCMTFQGRCKTSKGRCKTISGEVPSSPSRNCRAAGSIPARDLKVAFFTAVCSWLGLINVYKFPLDNFHLQDPLTNIQSSEMPTKSCYLPVTQIPVWPHVKKLKSASSLDWSIRKKN